MKNAALLVIALRLFAHGAEAARARPRQALRATKGHDAKKSMQPRTALYKSDCFKKRPVFLVEGGSRVNTSAKMIPGAGMDHSAIEPFQTVLKDGYYYVDCFKDYMYYFGDKFGDHKYDYALKEVSSVSIVNYDDMVPKQDRQPMTQATCFAFCRTVPDMGFFGITNGRSCYCMPYLKRMEGESSQCDATCEGDKASTCGGKTKSSVFEMHMCQQTFGDLMDASEALKAASTNMTSLANILMPAATAMGSMATSLQEMCGQGGDPGCSGLAQLAKVRAGALEAAASAAFELESKYGTMISEGEGMVPASVGGAPPLSHEDAEKAESLTKGMKEATTKALEETSSLEALLASAAPPFDENGDPKTEFDGEIAMYKDIMYFVNKSFVNMSTTCTGKPVAEPLSGPIDFCAHACESHPKECVGFQWIPHGDLCFLFEKMTSVQYYTGCTSDEPEERCMVKYSEFDGTTLEPDPSGKCPGCLKEAKMADRCLSDFAR